MINSRLAHLITGFALCSIVPMHAAVETYDIDPAHTWVGFSVGHFFTKLSGTFNKVTGKIIVDREHLTNSTVEAIIEVASIATNTSEPHDDLRSEHYFGLAKFPAITFKSREWKSTGGDTYAVTGDLTIKNVTMQVVLNVTSLGFGTGNKGSGVCGWEVSTTLDRRDFGIAADQGMIGNSVEIVINVRADLNQSAPPP